MSLNCPSCKSVSIKKNGHIHNGKQNHRCLSCGRQFVLNPKNKLIKDETQAQVRQALLERVSLEGICRIFNVSMPWLLSFIDKVIAGLPANLNATVTAEGEEFEVAVLELDEQWSFVGNKGNQQWLWLVFHSSTRQVLAMHVGKRSRQSAEVLLKKVPEDLKKKPSFTLISSLCTTRFFLGASTTPSEKNPERQATLRDLTTLLGSGAQD
jgi:transposase-like protein